MNTAKISSYNRLIAFFLIAIALLSVLVISANGWQIEDSPFWEEDSKNEEGNENTEKLPETEVPEDPPEPEPPKFYHHITGVEITEEEFGDSQVAYVIDGNSPLCGIANCNVLIEFPIENGKTRYIMINDKGTDLTKIGSITNSRYFMSNLAVTFGASVISLGNDDTIDYQHIDTGIYNIDLPKNQGSYYTEYTYFAYTSTKLINPLLQVTPQKPYALPYLFKEDTDARGNISASTMTIPYDTLTTLIYSKEKNGYCLCKMGSDRIDVSTSESAIFNNVFILFADSMTYESSDKTEMVMSTIGTGTGYYAYNGMAEKITWSMDLNGNLTFLNEAGEKLEVGRGNSYIAYVKSSKSNSKIFS